MPQRLHHVFGGKLSSPERNAFKDIAKIHIVGMFHDYRSACLAWKAEAQRTVDKADMRHFVANIHRLRAEAKPGPDTRALTT